MTAWRCECGSPSRSVHNLVNKMKIHLPSAFRLGRLLMPVLHALQSKITEAKASKSTAAKNMSFSVTSLINGCVMLPALQTTRTALRRAERR